MIRPEGASSVPDMLVRELAEGQEIDQVLLVRDRSRGGERLRLKLGDRTGCVRADGRRRTPRSAASRAPWCT